MAEERPQAGRRGIGDIIGGFVAGLYSVPEGIGYASLAGINPMLGIYAGMVPVAVAAATTGSVLMMSTLTSAIALTMGGVLESTSYTGDQVSQAVFTMALLAGAVMVALGLLEAGQGRELRVQRGHDRLRHGRGHPHHGGQVRRHLRIRPVGVLEQGRQGRRHPAPPGRLEHPHDRHRARDDRPRLRPEGHPEARAICPGPGGRHRDGRGVDPGRRHAAHLGRGHDPDGPRGPADPPGRLHAARPVDDPDPARRLGLHRHRRAGPGRRDPAGLPQPRWVAVEQLARLPGPRAGQCRRRLLPGCTVRRFALTHRRQRRWWRASTTRRLCRCRDRRGPRRLLRPGRGPDPPRPSSAACSSSSAWSW